MTASSHSSQNGRARCGESLTIQAARAFFSQRRELQLLRNACTAWRKSPRGVAVEWARYRPHSRHGFRQVTVFAVMSDDWPGMGEACLGVVHERSWNVHFANGFVLREKGTELGVFVMALGLGGEEDVRRMNGEIEGILEQLRRMGIGRRAKMILLAREAKKLKMLSSVIEELGQICTDEEVYEITAPMGECSKFFGGRSDEYLDAWPPPELAHQVASNYRLLEKVRKSGGLGVVGVEPRKARRETRTCVTVVGLRRDVSVEDCLRVAGETLGFYEQYHLTDFTTRDGLCLVRLEIGLGGGRPLSDLHHAQLERKLKELITGRRAAWAHRIEARGGFEQYARAIIPFLMKEQEGSGRTQIYIAMSSRETTTAGFKLIFVYAASLADIRPAQRLPVLLQDIPGVSIDSVVPPRSVRHQRFFIMNVKVDLGQFDDTETVYMALKERIREVFPVFRDFDEGMRRLETTRLKDVETMLPEAHQALADRVFYSMDEFSRLGMSGDQMATLIGLAVRAMDGFSESPSPGSRQVVEHQIVYDEDTPAAALIAIARDVGQGIPSCVSHLQIRADVTVSQLRQADADLTLCRVVGQGSAALDVAAVQEVIACLSEGDEV